MMKKIIIEGGMPLCGNICPQGSKNAALPILFATIATKGISVLYDVPDIGDIEVAIKILSLYGVRISREGNVLYVDSGSVKYTDAPSQLTGMIRASSYLYGSCLVRFGMVGLTAQGGCNFDDRPIDLHIKAATLLGAELKEDRLIGRKLKGSEIVFDKVSVGATINALIMASSAEGRTVIRGGAREPHVLSLIDFLTKAGASITLDGTDYIVEGRELHGAEYRIIPDMIEVGTYLLAAPLTGGRITVHSSVCKDLTSFFDKLIDFGITVKYTEDHAEVEGAALKSASVITSPYPGYPTDLAPQISVIMASFFGGTVEETVWRARFGYLRALNSFGVNYSLGGSKVTVIPSSIKCASVAAPDLRGGAACLLAALTAKGKSEIYSPQIILRGYSSLQQKLTALGAGIKIE
jgi:UDP-N-acetylglucosamine 1-carboxyvinyltransferase